MPVIFWTDALIALLLLIVVVFCFYVRRKEHLRAPWRQVARNRLGMAAAVVLGAYLLIGVLDSIHFHPPLATHPGEIQYSTRVLSVFDLIATPLRERVEKTYSAPFATHLYAKETLTLADGRQIRDYPRLKYGGAHLNDPETDRGYDIVQTIVWASLEALAIWTLVAGLSIALLARHWHMRWREGLKAVVGERTELPW